MSYPPTITLGHTATGPLRVDVPTLIDTRQVITASSGGGKSWLLRRIIELIARQVQVIVIDPEGEFATLRERFDMLLIGAGGEIAAEPRTARKLSAKLAELRVSAVVDLYDLGDWDARRAFLASFLEGLMAIPKSAYHPIYIPIDEAHNFAPETAAGKSDSPVARSRRAVNFLMSAGRKRAICGALATQRISKLDKDAIGDAKNVFIGGITLDVDQARAGDMLGLGKADRLALRDLEPGEFYCFGPAIGRGVHRFRTDAVITTHPRPGQRHLIEVPPASAAVQKIVASLADLPQQVQAEADEFAASRRRIAELERELRARPTAAAPERIVERVEIPIFKDGEVDRLESVVRDLTNLGGTLRDASTALAAASGLLPGPLSEVSAALHAAVHRPTPGVSSPARPMPRHATTSHSPVDEHKPSVGLLRTPPAVGDRRLPKAERAILTVLAQRGDRTKRQVAVQAGYAVKGGGFNNAVGALATAGYLTRAGDTLSITDSGIASLGDYTPLPAGRALLDHWLTQLNKAERAVLSALADAYPDALDKATVAQLAGYEVSGGGFNNALGKLRTLELISGSRELRASDDLFGR